MTRRPTIAPRPRRSTREPVVPMINVVFLLLIFFLMTAQIVPPAPFDLDLPIADGSENEGTATLYLSAQGAVGFEDLRGEAAMDAAAQRSGDTVLRIQADANLDATRLARTLARLAARGVAKIELVTEGG